MLIYNDYNCYCWPPVGAKSQFFHAVDLEKNQMSND